MSREHVGYDRLAQARDGVLSPLGLRKRRPQIGAGDERTAADVPADGRRVVVKLRARRMRCPVLGCAVQTFR